MSTGQAVPSDVTPVASTPPHPALRNMMLKNRVSLTTCHTWTDSVDLRRLSLSHPSLGDDPEPVRQTGIEDKDVRAPGGARFLLDGSVSL